MTDGKNREDEFTQFRDTFAVNGSSYHQTNTIIIYYNASNIDHGNDRYLTNIDTY